jgi:hypothetical protein
MDQETIEKPVQRQLPIPVPGYKPPSFCSIMGNELLGRMLDELDARYHFSDGTHRYRQLVNTAISKVRPFHRWFRYREGYAGELVKDLISVSDIDPRRHFVADPMCGSGTTLVASNEKGYFSLGLDVSPFAVEISNLKVFPYKNRDIEQAFEWSRRLKLGRMETYESIGGQHPCAKYFHRPNLAQVLWLDQEIKKLDGQGARNIARAAWLAILEDCSNRRKDGNGLLTRPSQVNDVLRTFIDQIDLILSDLTRHPLPKGLIAQAKDHSALEFSGAADAFARGVGKKCGAIIFSPPYANSFDYFESYKIELLLGGYFTFQEFQLKRRRLIRNYRIGYKKELQSSNKLVELLCAEIWKAIPKKESKTGIRDGRTRLVPNMLRGYFEDMATALGEFYKSLIVHGRVHIVVDQSAYVGVPIPTDLILASIAEEQGFAVRRIVKCRPANTSGQQLREFPYLKDLLRESIVDLEKISNNSARKTEKF